MLKKILATLLIVTITQVYANQTASQKMMVERELAQTFDDLNYKLSVEWNQTDNAFFDDSMKGFEAQIANLQKKGLTNDDLVKFTISSIKDKASQDEVTKMVAVINDNNLSIEEARSFAVSHLNKTYAQGASWSGGRVAVRVALLLAAVLIIALVTCKSEEVVTPSETPVPTETPEPTYTPTPSPTYTPTPSPTYSPCYDTDDDNGENYCEN